MLQSLYATAAPGASAPDFRTWNIRFRHVTPELAAELLQNNAGNRKARRSLVAKYATTMKSGGWDVTPEAIILSKTGRLLNGQHRLQAVIESGETLILLFIENVDEAIFKRLDRGAPRSISDALQIDKKLAEVARFSGLLMSPPSQGGNSISDLLVEELSELLAAPHSEVMDATSTVAKVFSSVPFRTAATLRILGGADPERVKAMYRNFVLGNVHELPPVGQALVGAIAGGRIGTKGGGATQRELFARAWDAFDPEKADLSRSVIRSPKRQIEDARNLLLTACAPTRAAA